MLIKTDPVELIEEEWRRNCSSVKPSSEEVDVKVDANEVADLR